VAFSIVFFKKCLIGHVEPGYHLLLAHFLRLCPKLHEISYLNCTKVSSRVVIFLINIYLLRYLLTHVLIYSLTYLLTHLLTLLTYLLNYSLTHSLTYLLT